jgi:hypothetical protein
LGLYAKVRLTPEWQTFHTEFVAAEDDEVTRIHFDLGGKSIGVDLTSVVLERVDAAENPEIPAVTEGAAQNGRHA